MDKEDEGKEVRTLVGLVIVSGAVLIIISFFIKDPKLDELHYIIRGLGISIIGGAIIAWAIGHLLSKAKFKKIYEDMQELNKEITATDENINNINENIRSSFDLIEKSEANGLLKIYEPYDWQLCNIRSRKPSDDFKADIKEALEREEKEIKICGLSLRLFFNAAEIAFFGEMQGAFKRMDLDFERVDKDDKFAVKILMIHPESKWKSQRQSVENKFTVVDKLEKDLTASIYELNETLSELKNSDKIMDNIRFYNATPDFFLFITSQWIIFEIYHMGAFELEKETDRGVKSLGLGGHVPVFKFDNKSQIYKYLSAQFDYYFEKKLVNKLSGMDVKLEESLDKNVISEDFISEDLKKKIKVVGVSLSGNATIRKEGTDKWVLTDGEEIHIIKKEKGVLYIEKQNEYHAGTLNEWLKSKVEQS